MSGSAIPYRLGDAVPWWIPPSTPLPSGARCDRADKEAWDELVYFHPLVMSVTARYR